MEQADVLIVGAGPTGLAAALFLAQRGVRARVIDANDGPSQTSRAQVVNPRALELLAETSVTQAVIDEGRAIRGVRFYEAWKPLAELELRDLPSRFAMTVLPQSRTEHHLAAALAKHGIEVERRVALHGLEQDAEAVHARCGDARVSARLLLGADGSRSVVRRTLGIPFEGHAFPEDWPLFDLALGTPLDLEHAHVSFYPDGLVFMLAIRPGLWRVFANVPDVLQRLPSGTTTGEVFWQSSFHIADRLAPRLVQGRVALAGDAAHIHSPVGARGMNLGIEDAYVYAACAAEALSGPLDRLADYQRLRTKVHARVVTRMDRLTRLARGRPAWVGSLRRSLIPLLTGWSPVARRMRAFLAGVEAQPRVR